MTRWRVSAIQFFRFVFALLACSAKHGRDGRRTPGLDLTGRLEAKTLVERYVRRVRGLKMSRDMITITDL